MSRVLYTADLHFNHPKVAEYRGFDTSTEHDWDLISKINDNTTERDQLWVLGDLGMGSLTPILERCRHLRPELHLVWGNHDAGHPMHKNAHVQQRRYLEVFKSVHLFAQHRQGTTRYLLSHYPYRGDHTAEDRDPQWRPRDEGLPLVHGHVHDKWMVNGNQINVGVDKCPLGFVEQEDILFTINRPDPTDIF